MILLGIETATSICGVALLRDDLIVAESILDRPRAHSEFLVPMIGDLLRHADLAPADLTAIAVSSGPGSYTGLRIGVSTAKGLAAAVDASIVAVPSLEGVAEVVRPFAESGDLIVPAFHARRHEIFAASFRVHARDGLESVQAPQAIGLEAAVAWLDDHTAESIWLVGDGWKFMAESAIRPSIRVLAEVRPRPDAIARLGSGRLKRNLTENLSTFEPHYLKEFVAKKPSASAFEKLPF
ncbi:MAG: tRNA (adenosine(37)-N6)-threonylcarbamoyltransferase complex dimerization subunit type 1 TsaB [Rhodothermales bacterium]